MLEYNKEIKIGNGRTCGYVYFCDRHHPLSMPNGTVYLHRHNASLKVGHWLSKDEHVHHIDGNKENNSIDNLLVLSHSEHSKLEQNNLGNIRIEYYCRECNKKLFEKSKTDMCDACYRKSTRMFDPTKEELEELVRAHPLSYVSKIYGVSQNSIVARCRKLGIEKKSYGYRR